MNQSAIPAPVSGPVMNLYIKDETPLSAGTQIMTIGDLSTKIIETDILSEEINQIKKGQKALISGKALNNTIIFGEVYRIFPAGFTKISALGVEQQRVKVYISFDNKLNNLLPGTSLDIKIITDEEKNTLIIPEKSLFKKDDKWYVFKINQQNAELQELSPGLKNDDFVQVLSGLEENQIIISEITNELEGGIKVRSVEE